MSTAIAFDEFVKQAGANKEDAATKRFNKLREQAMLDREKQQKLDKEELEKQEKVIDNFIEEKLKNVVQNVNDRYGVKDKDIDQIVEFQRYHLHLSNVIVFLNFMCNTYFMFLAYRKCTCLKNTTPIYFWFLSVAIMMSLAFLFYLPLYGFENETRGWKAKVSSTFSQAFNKFDVNKFEWRWRFFFILATLFNFTTFYYFSKMKICLTCVKQQKSDQVEFKNTLKFVTMFNVFSLVNGLILVIFGIFANSFKSLS